MGFFAKLKQNFKHGGIKIKVDAPATISMRDASFDATVTLQAEEAQTINSITIGLARIPSDMSQGGDRERTIMSTTNDQTFTMNPGETKTVTIKVAVNTGKEVPDGIDPNSTAGKLVSLAGKAMSAATALDNTQYNYSVVATADVEGVSFDPSSRISVQFLKPGQIGTNLRVGR